jgi:transcriptional regulator with XRE-family HTH domain
MRVRQIRMERGMSQERFAELVDVSVDFLSLIERGINAPSFETLEKIARKLRRPVADLFNFQ